MKRAWILGRSGPASLGPLRRQKAILVLGPVPGVQGPMALTGCICPQARHGHLAIFIDTHICAHTHTGTHLWVIIGSISSRFSAGPFKSANHYCICQPLPSTICRPEAPFNICGHASCLSSFTFHPVCNFLIRTHRFLYLYVLLPSRNAVSQPTIRWQSKQHKLRYPSLYLLRHHINPLNPIIYSKQSLVAASSTNVKTQRDMRP